MKKEIQEKDQIIQDKEQIIQEKEQIIKGKDQTMQEKDQILSDLKGTQEMLQIERIKELNEKIVEFKVRYSKENGNKIDELQKILTGNSPYSPTICYVKSSFKHFFGAPI